MNSTEIEYIKKSGILFGLEAAMTARIKRLQEETSKLTPQMGDELLKTSLNWIDTNCKELIQLKEEHKKIKAEA